MGGSRHPFATSEILEQELPAVQECRWNPFFVVWTQFRPGILYGPLTAFDAWWCKGGDPEQDYPINNIRIIGGNVELAIRGAPPPAVRVGFVGPPPYYRSESGAMLHTQQWTCPLH